MDYLNTRSAKTEALFRRARGARIECERLDAQIMGTLGRIKAIAQAMAERTAPHNEHASTSNQQPPANLLGRV